MCLHLQPLEDYLAEKKIPETFRGQAWSANCREWAYYDCILQPEALKQKLSLPSCISVHENRDLKSGMELGLVCTLCKDGIMGVHPANINVAQKQIVD